jgi:multiple sugar transport system substrate-binding protein
MRRRETLLSAITASALLALARTRAAKAAEAALPVVSGQKFSDQEVIVVSQTGPVISGPVQHFSPIWEKASGGKVDLVTYPFGEMFEKLRTALATGTYTADLINITTNWAGDFIGGGFLEDVPEDTKKLADFDDYTPIFRNSMTWQGKTAALVYDGNVHNLFYRRDLFENLDYKKRFADQRGYELTTPTTWEQLYDVGKFFNGFDWSGTGHSFGWLEPIARGNVMEYFLIGRAASYSKKVGDPHLFFEPKSMTPRLTEPGWIQALEDMKKDAQCGPRGMIQYGYAETRPVFVNGQSAMIVDWGDIGTLSYDKDSKIRGKTGTALVPGATKLYNRVTKAWEKPAGGVNYAPYLAVTAWMWAVPKSAKNKAAAWDLAAFLCNPKAAEVLVAYPDSGIQPSRKSSTNPEAVKTLIDAGMDPTDAAAWLKAIGMSISHPNAVLDMEIPGGGEYYNYLDTEASRFLAGEISAAQAMKNAADSWERTTDRLGRDTQRKLYIASTTA